MRPPNVPTRSLPARAAWPLLLAGTLLASGCAWSPRPQVAERSPKATVVAQQAVVTKTAVAAARQTSRPMPGSSREAVAVQGHLADFGRQRASADARHIANWVVDSGDAEGRSFVIVDKKDARVFLFDSGGKLLGAAPALLGAAKGDDAVPGIGEKPLKEVKPEEKTTPAGRYVAEPGVNSNGEDIIWVSYDLAVSMHRVRPLVKAERRLQRLASPTPKDNRISFGCINLPVAFYERLLRPTVVRTGAVIYVLPETRTPQAQFASYDVVPQRAQVAGLSPRKPVK